MDYVKRELARGIDDWETRLSTALVKSSPTDLVRHSPSEDSESRGFRLKAEEGQVAETKSAKRKTQS
jgi:hypothetical protein